MFEIDPLKLGSNNKICITQDNYNFAFIPIPKNASSWTYYYFRHYGWKYFQCENDSEIENKHKIIILRNPFERYFSGLAQEIFIQKLNFNLDNPNDLDKIFSRLYFGLHTRHQSYFVGQLKKDQCYFFNLDNNFKNNIFEFTKNTLNLEPYIELSENSGTSIMDYSIKDKIEKIVKGNKNYYRAVENFLSDDLNLYYSTSFYKG